jgi:hypothetical protein
MIHTPAVPAAVQLLADGAVVAAPAVVAPEARAHVIKLVILKMLSLF